MFVADQGTRQYISSGFKESFSVCGRRLQTTLVTLKDNPGGWEPP